MNTEKNIAQTSSSFELPPGLLIMLKQAEDYTKRLI